MNAAMLHFSHFEQLAAGRMIAAVWQATLLVALTALVLRLIPRLSAAARFVAWSAVFVTILLLPFAQHSDVAAAVTGWKVSTDWSAGLAILWLTLSSWRALQLLGESLRVQQIRARAYPVTSNAKPGAGILPCVQNDGEKPEMPALSAMLCLSSDVERPTVLGLIRPMILIPQSLYERLTAPELEHILLHEAQHLRRRDLWLNLLQKIGLVLFPLNPALFWVERQLCFERELACDESVLAATDTPQSYARSLVSLAEHSLLGRQISLALGAWGRPPELSRRVHRILAAPAPALSSRAATAVLALICVGLLGLTAVLARAPRLVAFVNPQPAALASVDNSPMQSAPAGNGVRTIPVSSSDAFPRLTPAVMRTRPAADVLMQRPTHHAARRNPRAAVPRRVLASYASATRKATPARRLEAGYIPAGKAGGESFARPARRPVRARQRSGEYAASPTIVLTVFASPYPSPTYAAVPTANGWIVFEL